MATMRETIACDSCLREISLGAGRTLGGGQGYCATCNRWFCPNCAKPERGLGALVVYCCPTCGATLKTHEPARAPAARKSGTGVVGRLLPTVIGIVVALGVGYWALTVGGFHRYWGVITAGLFGVSAALIYIGVRDEYRREGHNDQSLVAGIMLIWFPYVFLLFHIVPRPQGAWTLAWVLGLPVAGLVLAFVTAFLPMVPMMIVNKLEERKEIARKAKP